MALATRLRRIWTTLVSSVCRAGRSGAATKTQRDAGLAHERPQLRAHQAEQLGHRDVAEIDVDPAGLDLGDVQQVADEPELLLGHPADEADLGLLLAGERRLAVEEQLGQGHDRVQRRAQLVAHVGQEARLALVGVAQAIGAVVELGVEGHDAAVGAVELAVEAEQLVLARADLAERLQQLLVLARDLVVGARARAPRQLFAARRARRGRARRAGCASTRRRASRARPSSGSRSCPSGAAPRAAPAPCLSPSDSGRRARRRGGRSRARHRSPRSRTLRRCAASRTRPPRA